MRRFHLFLIQSFYVASSVLFYKVKVIIKHKISFSQSASIILLVNMDNRSVPFHANSLNQAALPLSDDWIERYIQSAVSVLSCYLQENVIHVETVCICVCAYRL